MSKHGTGAAAAAAAFGAWIVAPMVSMRRKGTLDDQQVRAIRGESHIDFSDPDAAERVAIRRARVREAQVRAAVAAIPAQRADDDLPRRSPLTG